MDALMEDNIHLIVTCQCHDTPQFAEDAYKLLHGSVLNDSPETVQIVSKESQIIDLVKDFSMLPNKTANKTLQAVVASEKFAIYMEAKPSGQVVQVWNLLTGRRMPWVS